MDTYTQTFSNIPIDDLILDSKIYHHLRLSLQILEFSINKNQPTTTPPIDCSVFSPPILQAKGTGMIGWILGFGLAVPKREDWGIPGSCRHFGTPTGFVFFFGFVFGRTFWTNKKGGKR